MYNFSSKLWINKRSVSAAGETTIYLQVVIDGKHKEFNLKLRWPIDKIDLLQSKLMPRHKLDIDCNAFNIVIQTYLSKHNEINRAFLLRNENLDIQKFVNQLTFFDDKENLAAYMERERIKRLREKTIEKISYNNVGAVIKCLLRYDKEPKFINIDEKWMRGFKIYLQKTPYKKDCYYKASTIWAFIKGVKTYLHYASLEPLIFINAKAYEFPNPEPPSRTEYLDREELRRLLILQNSGNLTDLQARVLKAFLFQCYTGLRISDIYKANNTWHVQDNFLFFLPHKNRKNGKWLKIPLMGPALQIIKRATDKFFNLPNQAQFNETLKIIAFKAQISKNLKSHMGRHTFGFLIMTSVGNLYALQELLGHQKIEATQRYSHLNEEYKLKAVREMADSFMDYTI